MGKKEFDLILEAIAEARGFTRKGHDVTVDISASNGLETIDPNKITDILLILQDDEEILKVKLFPQYLIRPEEIDLTLAEILTDINYPAIGEFTIDILDGFDEWCADYWAKRPTQDLLPTRGEEAISVPESEITYRITFTKGREILLNDRYKIATPDFDRENEQVFSYLYNHSNEKFTTRQLEGELRMNLVKSFHKIVENLGFKGALRKAFFSVSQDSIQFRNPIKSKDLAPSVVAELDSLIAKD